MIRLLLERLRPPKWTKPAEVKKFAWSPATTKAFMQWSHDKQAVQDDLPIAWLFQGTMLGAELWASVDHWWNRYPEHFGMFWAIVQKQPRQKWSQAALRTLAIHVPVDEVENLVRSALLCDDGRAWLLTHQEYGTYLRNIGAEALKEWVRSTTYSMPSLFESFDGLVKLQRHIGQGPQPDALAAALAWHFQEQEKLDPSTNVGKAWGMPTAELDKWMDEDKQLPFWFDPVNRTSWQSQCRNWIEKTGYVVDSNSPLRLAI